MSEMFNSSDIYRTVELQQRMVWHGNRAVSEGRKITHRRDGTSEVGEWEQIGCSIVVPPSEVGYFKRKFKEWSGTPTNPVLG